MPAPRVLVLRAPGTNCDVETAFAFEQAGGKPESVHVGRLVENPRAIDDFQILVVPGGFSYGDDIASGRILSNQIRHHLADALAKFKSDGKLILGICNGFQILIQTQALLPDGGSGQPSATLTFNESAKFEDRWVNLATAGDKCVFLKGIKSMYLPVAHAEGKFVARDEATFKQLETSGQLVLRYTLPGAASGTVPYPANPNGAMGNVAGMCDETGRVLGLMPHPERHIDPTHHPRWTRRAPGDHSKTVGDGLALFQNAVAFFG